MRVEKETNPGGKATCTCTLHTWAHGGRRWMATWRRRRDQAIPIPTVIYVCECDPSRAEPSRALTVFLRPAAPHLCWTESRSIRASVATAGVIHPGNGRIRDPGSGVRGNMLESDASCCRKGRQTLHRTLNKQTKNGLVWTGLNKWNLLKQESRMKSCVFPPIEYKCRWLLTNLSLILYLSPIGGSNIWVHALFFRAMIMYLFRPTAFSFTFWPGSIIHLSHINKSYIVLLQKKDGANKPDNFSPISLRNPCLKIHFKCLTLLLRDLIHFLVILTKQVLFQGIWNGF
jgi:hypothetical protein